MGLRKRKLVRQLEKARLLEIRERVNKVEARTQTAEEHVKELQKIHDQTQKEAEELLARLKRNLKIQEELEELSARLTRLNRDLKIVAIFIIINIILFSIRVIDIIIRGVA